MKSLETDDRVKNNPNLQDARDHGIEGVFKGRRLVPTRFQAKVTGAPSNRATVPSSRRRRETKVRLALSLATSLSWGDLSRAATVPPGTQTSVSVGSLHSHHQQNSSNQHGPHAATIPWVQTLGGWTGPPLQRAGEAVPAGSCCAPSDKDTLQSPEAAPSTLAEVMKGASYSTSCGCVNKANASQCNRNIQLVSGISSYVK